MKEKRYISEAQTSNGACARGRAASAANRRVPLAHSAYPTYLTRASRNRNSSDKWAIKPFNDSRDDTLCAHQAATYEQRTDTYISRETETFLKWTDGGRERKWKMAKEQLIMMERCGLWIRVFHWTFRGKWKMKNENYSLTKSITHSPQLALFQCASSLCSATAYRSHSMRSRIYCRIVLYQFIECLPESLAENYPFTF